MGAKSIEKETDIPEAGEFPFPLSHGAKESQYLNWLRNHSNYMVTRGFFDYLRIAAILMRGILLNLLIIIPFLSIISILVGLFYGPQLRSATIFWSDFPIESVDGFAERLAESGSGEPRSPGEGMALQDLVTPKGAMVPGDELASGDGEAPDGPVFLDESAKVEIRGLDVWLWNRLYEKTRLDLEQLRDLQTHAEDVRHWIDEIKAIESPNFLDKLKGRSSQALTLGLLNVREKIVELRIKNARRDLHGALLADILELIGDELVYRPKLFTDISLNQETKDLLYASDGHTNDPSGADLRRLNRLLLEDAYPEITKHESYNPGIIYNRVREMGFSPSMPQPFTLTVYAVLLALALVLFAPVLKLFGEIKGQQQSMVRAGSDSSVEMRDKFERLFGLGLLLIISAVAFETLPVMVDRFHHFLASPNMNWNAIFTSAAGVSVAVMGVASKLLSALSGLKKRLAMLVISLLGVLAPLMVILYVTDFLVYPPALTEAFSVKLTLYVVLIIPSIFVVLILFGMLFGYLTKSFKIWEQFRLLLMALVLFGLILLAFYKLDDYSPDRIEDWNYFLVIVLTIELWIYCRIAVDINWTSIHGLYRDRLASAYLVGRDTKGDVAIEEDINLWEIGRHEKGSIAPYHLINSTLNLQGSKDLSLRDRSSDFFIFSKRFVGGGRTGYCRTATLEQVHPQMNLATAMAISAAAASPNMGRATTPAMVALMVLLNIRLGYWLPNPGLLEEKLSNGGVIAAIRRIGRFVLKKIRRDEPAQRDDPPGFSFLEIFDHEISEIERRWSNVYSNHAESEQRRLDRIDNEKIRTPTTAHGLVGIGFSGGGIRSATINLGIAQALHARGVFDHIDYMSTVSGGGYLGASISTLMRQKAESAATPTAEASFHTLPYKHRTEIDGVAHVSENFRGESIVIVVGQDARAKQKEYRFLRFDKLAVKSGDEVRKGQELIERHNALWDRFKWRVRPMALLREMMMRLDETGNWVNLSDGGHIENLAGMELLRRRCRFIIIGDGEADPDLSFNGLATLIRYARVDLGIKIDIDTDAIAPDRSKTAVEEGRDRLCRAHWAMGTITYPALDDDEGGPEVGYLLYLKSSFSGDEDEVIKEYRHRNPSFPHQSTADQFFNEEQFECYRALGEHIGDQPFKGVERGAKSGRMSYREFSDCFIEWKSQGNTE